jgi:hypothetical protein
VQISRNSFTLLAGAAASALILSACGGGSSSTPTPTAQAALTVAAASTTLDPSATTLLSVSGGNGTGATTYNATGACTVSGTTLTAASTGGACSVTATKAADSTYSAITSSALTVTVRAPQAALTVAAASTSLSAGGTTNLSTTGGSGAGAVTYQVTAGGCTVSAAVLTAPASVATCSVTATKAADGSSFAQATSSNTLTVTVTVPTTAFLTFDETTAPTLTAFSSAGTMAATIETDPAVSTNKVAKLVKSAGSDTWAGATISKCAYPTFSLPVIPLSAGKMSMSMKVYSTLANKVVRLKLEDASNNAITVETDATVTAANTWQTLTFNFASPATNGGNPTRSWTATDTLNKASVFPDYGNTAASTMYVDDLTFIGTSGVSQTCMTAPAAPTAAANVPTVAALKVIAVFSDTYTPVATGPFPTNWSNPTSGDNLVISGNTARKLGSLVFAGLEPSATINASTYTKFNISVWTLTGTSFKVKLVDFGANGTYQGGDDVEHELTFTAPTQNAWTYYSINLSDFTGLTTKANIAQIIMVGSGGDYYIDDIFFSKP